MLLKYPLSGMLYSMHTSCRAPRRPSWPCVLWTDNESPSVQCAVCSVQCSVCSVQCSVQCIQYTVCGAVCSVYSVYYTSQTPRQVKAQVSHRFTFFTPPWLGGIRVGIFTVYMLHHNQIYLVVGYTAS